MMSTLIHAPPSRLSSGWEETTGTHCRCRFQHSKRRLKEQGLLASTWTQQSDGREVEHLEARKVLQGKRRSVLHFNVNTLVSSPFESVPCVPCVPMGGDSYLGTEGIGTQTWNTNGHSADFVFHESVPQEAGFVSEPEP